MNDFLLFHDAYLEKDTLYFSAKNMNGLFRYDLVDQTTTMIATFEAEPPWMKNLHHQIIAYHRNLYFIPCMGTGITRFDLETEELDYIDLSDYIELFPGGVNPIAGAFLKGDKLLLVSMHLPRLLYLDLKTNRLEKIHDAGLGEIIRDERDRLMLFDLQGTCVVGKQLILVAYNQNYYLSVDMDNMAVQKHVVSEEAKLDNVYFDGDYLWMNTAFGASVFRITYGTNEIKKYDVFTEKTYARPFFSVQEIGNRVALMPFEEDAIYYYREEEDDWIKGIGNCLKQGKRADSMGMLFWKKAEWNNRYLLFPEGEDGMWVLDRDLQMESKIAIAFGEKAKRLEGINKAYMQVCMNANAAIQEDIVFLQEYMQTIESRQDVAAEIGANIGEKIYSQMK